MLRNTDNEDKCNNLINLIHLNEASILNTVFIRYFDNKIYTFNGNILLATNPFKNIGIYDKTYIDKYSKFDKNDLDPHAFLIGRFAMHNLKENLKNQSILVSGESGAGKTQTVKS